MAQQALPLQSCATERAGVSRVDPRVRPDHRLVFLDEIEVVEGACRQSVLRSAKDLVLGDELLFPSADRQAACVIAIGTRNARVRIPAPVDVGQTAFDARLSHRLILMSDHARLLKALLFAKSSGRFFLGLTELADPLRSYTLIASTAVKDAA